MKKMMKYLTRLAVCMVMLATSHPALHALDLDFYADSSKLATGTWVKISVTESGIYQITADDARSWGLGSDLSQIHVFGYGGAPLSEMMLGDNYADDLPQMPVVRTDDRILFYAQGPLTWRRYGKSIQQLQVQHPYAISGSYFVTNDSRFKDIDITEAQNNPNGEVVTTYVERLYHEQDMVNPGETGRCYLGENFLSNKSQTFRFDLEGLVPGSEVTSYTVFGALSDVKGSIVSHSYNGEKLPLNGGDGKDVILEQGTQPHYGLSQSVKSFTLDAGTSTLDFNVTFEPKGNVKLARLDYITINYERQLALKNGRLVFGINEASSGTRYRISGCSGTTHVWDVTAPFAPLQLKTVAGDGTVTFSPAISGRREFVAFEESGSYPHPEIVGDVSNQNIHGELTPDMIILAPSAYLDQAERVAELHRKTDGFRVLVLDQEKVFNEFSSGTRDAMAYRRLCKMFYDRGTSDDGHRMGYLLLFGNGTFDNRLIITNSTNTMNYPRLLTWQSDVSDNDDNSISTDDLFGILSDESGVGVNEKMSVSVGRMIVKSTSEARSAVNKLENYMTKPIYGSWKNQVLMVADDENSGIHMIQSDTTKNNMNRHGGSNMVFNHVYIDAFTAVSNGGSRAYPDARAKMFTALRDGVLWWNYIGHASTQNWTGDGLLMRTDLETQLFYKRLPVLYAATCEYCRFDNSILSGGEHMFNNPNGGVIALICPSRLAYVDANGVLSANLGRYVFSPDEKGRPRRIGDILRLTKNAIYSSSGNNNRRFFLFGDPAMRLAYAPYTAQIETINGKPIDSENMPVFKGREQVEFGGRILDWNGDLATNFNGSIISTLFGPEQSVTSHGYGKGIEYTFEERANRLAIDVDTVIAGQFNVRLIIPSEVNNEYDNFRTSMINLYAYDSLDTLEAKGANSDFYIYGYEDEFVADTIGPDIITMVLNDNSFVDGSDINESPLLLATVADKSGVNFSSAGIGHAITLTLDGTTSFNDLVSYYTPMYVSEGTLGSINYQLNDLAQGLHSLRLRVWDVYNNVSEKTITFNVKNGLKPDIADIYCTGNPASVETSFYVKHNRPDAVVNVTIEVYDLMGRLVWKTTQTGRSDMYTSTPVTWDLRDSGGRRVPRGIYVYRATISTDGVTEATKAKKLAVTGE